MKRFFRPLLIAALAGLVFSASAQAMRAPNGSVNFGKFTPPARGGEFVEVNVTSNLLAMVTRLAKNSEPAVADLLRGLTSIRVNVISLDDTNRTEVLERIKSIRDGLDHQSWTRLVTVQEPGQEVVVQVCTRGDQSVLGVAVTVVADQKQAVFVNLVGDVQIDKLPAIGERFNIEPLKKLGLQAAKKP